MRKFIMPQNPLDVAVTAMNHPNALEILESIRSLLEKEASSSMTTVATPENNVGQILPRSSELESQGVNIQNQQLQGIALQYPERLTSAVNAWLQWVSYTPVTYPTLSLIRAIEQNWEV